MNKNIVIFIILTSTLLAAGGLGIWAWQKNKEAAPGIGDAPQADAAFQFTAEARYNCGKGKFIKAKYYEGPAAPVQPGEMPSPAGKVELSLSDGREMTLAQTPSGSGAVYADGKEAFVFWNKGNAAFVHEQNADTFKNCVDTAGTSGNVRAGRR